MSQDKTIKVGGYARLTLEGDKLIVTPEGGLIAIAVCDLDGNKLLVHHPLSGWYEEAKVTKEPED